jgi:AAA domain-containing protein
LQILNTSKISAKDGIKTLVYGPSGVGKTRLSITAPGPFIFSAEKGLLSLRSNSIPYIDISSYAQMKEAYKWFVSSNEAKYVGTLFLDSLTEIAQVILAEEKKNNKDPRKAYMAMQDSVYELIRNFRDMKGRNIVLICWEQLIEQGLSKKACPVIPSEKLLAALPYFWDLVLHHYHERTSTGVVYQAFHTKDCDWWTAKDRGGQLDEIEEPNLTKLFIKAAS